MQRTEVNLETGEVKVLDLTPEEIAQAQAQEQAWLAEKAAEPTKEQQIAQLQAQIDALKT